MASDLDNNFHNDADFKANAAAAPTHVIVIGTSAGGFKALSVILAMLPADFPAAILIVQHLSADFSSRLAYLLNALTALHIQEAREGDVLCAGYGYVAPPGTHLLIKANLTLTLSHGPKVHHCRPSADVLFRSAADYYGPKAIGVVLTGGDGDGTAGIQAIKAAGGVTLAQDELSSQDFSMPRHAFETGDIDFVLPLPEIAAKLLALVMA